MIKRIIQIIPAPDWRVYYQGDNGRTFSLPLACFALGEDDDDKIGITIEPMVCSGDGIISEATATVNFLMIVGPGGERDEGIRVPE